MAIQGIGTAGISGISGAGTLQKTGGKQFTTTLKAHVAEPRSEVAPLQTKAAAPGKSSVQAPLAASPKRALEPAKILDQVAAAQKRMDVVLELAQSGKSFTPAELISLQSQMYRASQELDLAGKVIEKATGGVKQILQTQV